MHDWRNEHKRVIIDFINYLNRSINNYILKGGTSLMLFYGLDRFSEDIDFDNVPGDRFHRTGERDIFKIVSNFCQEQGYEYRIAKDTQEVSRVFIHYKSYGDLKKPLKVEVSYRKKVIFESQYQIIRGISVYNLDEICNMKVIAFSARDKIRDLYDLSYIVSEKYEYLPEKTIFLIQNALEYKGFDYFDYLVKTQNDKLIDIDKFETRFLSMCDKIGLLGPTRNKQQTEEKEALKNESDTLLKKSDERRSLLNRNDGFER